MSDHICITMNIHAAPLNAEAGTTVGFPLTLFFGGKFRSPEIAIFTGNQALTNDLAAAINGVLATHREAKGA